MVKINSKHFSGTRSQALTNQENAAGNQCRLDGEVLKKLLERFPGKYFAVYAERTANASKNAGDNSKKAEKNNKNEAAKEQIYIVLVEDGNNFRIFYSDPFGKPAQGGGMADIASAALTAELARRPIPKPDDEKKSRHPVDWLFRGLDKIGDEKSTQPAVELLADSETCKNKS